MSLEEYKGRVFVTRVSPDGPAAAAGIAPDDVILGIDGTQVHGLMDFTASSGAGARPASRYPRRAPGHASQPVLVKSGDRYRYLRLNPTY